MKRFNPVAWGFALVALQVVSMASAQEPNPTQRPSTLQAPQGGSVALFKIEVVQRTTPAVNYLHEGPGTKIDFKGTPLMPGASGRATVEAERGVTRVDADFKKMLAPSSFGPEYLTYVLWAISPDGRPVNIGELTLDDHGTGSDSKLKGTSELQTFGMIVTAEPYYAVTQPSDVVVMENVLRPDTKGVVDIIVAKYELLPRGMYSSQGKATGFTPVRVDKKNPLELYQAMNAVMLARVAGAARYAPDVFNEAVTALQQAEKYQTQKPGQNPVITMARDAVVRAEDARVVTIRRIGEESDQRERDASLARENAQRGQAELARGQAESARNAAAAAQVQAQAERLSAEQARAATADADRARVGAEAARLAADQARLQAEAQSRAAESATQQALAQQQALAAEAAGARDAAAKAQQDQVALRQQLLLQLNQILQTRDSARGLIINMSDVLFDTGKFTLKAGAREKLAKVSGIVLGHPGLRIDVEGHTDSVGTEELNQKLSERRAGGVREFLESQGLNQGSLTSKGLGEGMPIGDNATAAGRQANRRVELVVSGGMLDGTTAAN